MRQQLRGRSMPSMYLDLLHGFADSPGQPYSLVRDRRPGRKRATVLGFGMLLHRQIQEAAMSKEISSTVTLGEIARRSPVCVDRNTPIPRASN